MSLVETNARPFWQPRNWFPSLFKRMKRFSVDAADSSEESRARRTFILEMMDSHPDAFEHEFSCQTMMGLYRSRF